MADRNVLGGKLESCGTDPLTGFYRDGCCTTGPEDLGSHTICAVVTTEFLGGNVEALDRSYRAAGTRSTPRSQPPPPAAADMLRKLIDHERADKFQHELYDRVVQHSPEDDAAATTF